MTPVTEITGIADPAQFLRDVVLPCRPAILRGLVKDWPVVRTASSAATFRNYMLGFEAGGELEVFFGAPRISGKYYYSEDLKGFNFERRRMRFAAALDAIFARPDGAPAHTVYLGSVPVSEHLPGFAAENPMPLLAGQVQPRIWLGDASNVSSHYDTVDNLACVIAGERRFTLYSPELIDSLYVGPIDHTMAGQPVSMAASSPLDEAKYPRFAAVRDKALTADLRPGDALYLPKLWWHQVEATAPFNGLVNYWWDAFSAGPDAPYTSMLFAMITIAERPAAERHAWKAMFNHYVFREHGHPLAHLPAESHGLLGPLAANYGKLRARILYLLRGGA